MSTTESRSSEKSHHPCRIKFTRVVGPALDQGEAKEASIGVSVEVCSELAGRHRGSPPAAYFQDCSILDGIEFGNGLC